MNFLQFIGWEKTNSEIFIDENRKTITFEITVKPEDYINKAKCDHSKLPLAMAVQRAIEGTSFRLERAGFKAIVISRGIYQYAYFMPRRIWRKVNCIEFGDSRPSRPIKFKAEFEMIF